MCHAATRQRRLAAVVIVATAFSAARLLDVNLLADAAPDSLIERVVARTSGTSVAVKGTRDLSAGSTSGRHIGWMTVQTILTSSGQLRWRVLNEGGSERTRVKVLREVLEKEAAGGHGSEGARAALTPENYDFVRIGSNKQEETTYRVRARREEPHLINGTLTVSADGYPVVLEGTLAKSPSFWIKSVTIVKRFGRFAGVALPTTIESTADVRLIGRSSFTMRYHYEQVNGHDVGPAVVAAPTSSAERETVQR